MAVGVIAIEIAAAEVFARRPRSLLPARIGCAVVAYSTDAPPSPCRTDAVTAADVVCGSCGPRRVFLCGPCAEEIRWVIEAGSVWCTVDGALITGLAVAAPLDG